MPAALTFFRELTLEKPAWLLLLAAGPALWLVARRSLGDFPARQRALQTLVRLLVLGGVALALARPSLRRPVTDVSVVAAVDVSASVSDGGLAFERRMVGELESAANARRLTRPLPLRVVRFASDAAEWGAPGQPLPPPQRFAAADSLDTDIGKALALAGGLVDPGAIPRLVLISDGHAPAPDALAAAERAAARGVRIDVVPVGLPAGGDHQDGGGGARGRSAAP